MSQTRLQDEYNSAIRTCDIFVMLFFRKVGKYTEEEFVTAYNQFKDTGRPLIFTYFKDAQMSSGEINQETRTLVNFQEKMTELEHFYTKYKSVEDLIHQIDSQLNKLEKNGAFKEKNQDSESPQEIQNLRLSVILLTAIYPKAR